MSRIAVLNQFSAESVKDALNKLSRFPNLKVNGLNAHQLTELATVDPELFSEVSDNIKADRWFPYAGAWGTADELSEIALIKSCLYSVRYFYDNFGKRYRVFHGKKVYNNMLPQIVYTSFFDAVVLETETENKWLYGADHFRTLSMSADTVDIKDLNDDISSNEFISYEDLADEMFDGHLDLKTVLLPAGSVKPEGIEKILVDAEKYYAVSVEDKTAEIRKAWIAFFDGKTDSTKEIADEITDGKSPDESGFKLHGEGIILTEIKLAEDGSGDTIIRVAETKGKEQSAYIMCDRLNAGFRFEIMPYEIPTFRIPKDGNGYSKEIFICE